MTRVLVHGAGLAIVVLAFLLVPLPVLLIEPGPAVSVTGNGSSSALFELEGSSDELDGRYLVTTVQVRPAPAFDAVQALADDVEQVTFGRTIVPPGVDTEEFIDIQRQLFRESIRVAAAAGARAAGLSVEVGGGGARVAAVVPQAPAETALERGDVIVAVDGQPLELASELVAALEGRDLGETVRLRVQRGGRTVEREVELGPFEGGTGPGLGVLVRTVDLRIDLPVEVTANEDVRIGGPSGGLMLSLAMFDLLDDGDLAGGRTIAGTGTISLEGEVGPVSGIGAKVVAAARSGASVFLVPADQAGTARRAADGRIEVIAVSTLEEAIEALRGGGGAPDDPGSGS